MFCIVEDKIVLHNTKHLAMYLKMPYLMIYMSILF